MSESASPGAPGDQPAEPAAAEDANQPYPLRLAYAVYSAMMVDLGCILGAIAFVLLLLFTVVFATQLTPCTSAGGIPCTH
jgi:hypothetical protein